MIISYEPVAWGATVSLYSWHYRVGAATPLMVRVGTVPLSLCCITFAFPVVNLSLVFTRIVHMHHRSCVPHSRICVGHRPSLAHLCRRVSMAMSSSAHPKCALRYPHANTLCKICPCLVRVFPPESSIKPRDTPSR